MATKHKAPSTKAKEIYERESKGAKLGSGKRFEAMTHAMEAKGARNPEALSAAIGRKRHGAEKMAELAAAGRKRRHQ